MKSLIVLFSILWGTFCSAQMKGDNIFLTENGKVVINGELADTSIRLVTQNLYALLNYDDAQFELKLDVSTLYSGNAKIDSIFRTKEDEIISLKGKLDIDFINIEGHPPMDFVVDGLLSSSNKLINGKGRLEHLFDQGSYSCILTLSFILDKSDLGFDFAGIDLDDKINIEVIQIVMNKLEDF
ncbi:MAG: hypothetical protein COA33_003665 [Fluviicola sp.]|nr:hypothetical protein [Fluviicola sp.]